MCRVFQVRARTILALSFFLFGCSDDGGHVPVPDSRSADVLTADTSADSTAADSFVPPLPMDQLFSACVRASACGIKIYPRLFNCLSAYLNLYASQGLGPIYDAIYACVNAAGGDCAAIAACFRRGDPCDNSYIASCNGTVAVSCDLIDKRVYELDCGVAGLKCAIKSDQAFAASCSPGPCDTTFTDMCEGSRLLSCSYGVIGVQECALHGLSCGLGGWKTKTFSCQGETETKCSNSGKNPYQPSCDGAEAQSCVHDRVHVEDCSRLPLATACLSGTCVMAGSQCNSEFNRCSGAKLEACLDGSWKTFDCAALQLGPCEPNAPFGANCSDPAP